MWDFDAFILELESNFGPHDPIGDAENLLTNLTMNKKSKIFKYNVDFWKLAARVSWNKSALLVQYFSGLLLHLRIEVMSGGKPQTLGALCLKAQDADDIYWMQKNEMSHSSGNSSGKKDKSKSSSDNHNSNSNSNSNNSKPNSNSSSKSKSNSRNSKTSDKPKVNALTEKLGKDGKLTSEEWECRIKEKLCLYCGKPRHKALECNKSAAAKGRAATVKSKDSLESKK